MGIPGGLVFIPMIHRIKKNFISRKLSQENMFNNIDTKYLVRQLSQNQVILFIGSGFSYEAKNKSGLNFPIGNKLSELIWDFLSIDGEYDGTSLKEMFELLIDSGKPSVQISDFLEENLIASEIPEIYDVITKPYWHRIYTTNIDDVLKKVYKRNFHPKLYTLAYPYDEPEERDPYLEKIQLIYLNGKLPSKPEDLIFSKRQYAKTSINHQPFYEQFVREYSTHCTLFIGTSFEEDLVWQYIEARESRPRGISEGRPRSFLISKNIPTAKKILLKKYNLLPIDAEITDFLNWLQEILVELPPKEEILKNLFPNSLISGLGDRSKKHVEAIQDFSFSFEKVPIENSNSNDKSFYLLGASPNWSDLFHKRDATRSITSRILNEITENLELQNIFRIYALLGHAGSGKSTIIRRLGIELAQAGWNAFYTSSEEIPRFDNICKALEDFDRQTILIFDNAEIILRRLSNLVRELSSLTKPPVIIISARTNDYDRLISKYDDSVEIVEYQVPDLNREEIKEIIDILDKNHLLGKLRGLSDLKRIKEFEIRAQKQILVAMKEATSGKGFDDIIKDEFTKIEPHEAKMLCLCTALATDAGFRISIDEFVGCTKETPAEALHYLNRNLRGIAITTGYNKDLVGIRHRAIANHYIDCCEKLHDLKDSYIRILGVLSSEIKSSHWSTRVFSLYRDLINHNSVYNRFQKDIKEARSIYESLIDRFDDDFHFWLQYGSLELEGGSLELADNYLNQAKSLEPHDNYVINSIGHLEMRKAIESNTLTRAIDLCNEGEKILKEQILNTGSEDPYCYHIYCLQKYTWIRRWVKKDETKKSQLLDLLDVANDGVSLHPFNKRLLKLKETIERAYLNMSIRIEERPDDPVYTYGWD